MNLALGCLGFAFFFIASCWLRGMVRFYISFSIKNIIKLVCKVLYIYTKTNINIISVGDVQRTRYSVNYYGSFSILRGYCFLHYDSEIFVQEKWRCKGTVLLPPSNHIHLNHDVFIWAARCVLMFVILQSVEHTASEAAPGEDLQQPSELTFCFQRVPLILSRIKSPIVREVRGSIPMKQSVL